jgi:branched-chain amino acid transport system substrate-binding protein
LFLVILATTMVTLSPASAEITDGEVRYLILDDVTGAYNFSAGTGTLTAAEMALDDIGGKVGEYPVKIYFEDHKINDKVALRIADKYAKELNIDAISGLSGSNTAIPIQKWARDEEGSGIIVIHIGAGSGALTGAECSPTSVQWQWDTYSFAKGMTKGVIDDGGDKWFFITIDSGFGRFVEKDQGGFIELHGGEVVGSYLHGVNETNFFPMIEMAFESGANVISIANAGSGAINALRQAHELGAVQRGVRVVNFLTLLHDIRQIGLYTAKGLQFISPFFWNYDDVSRDFAMRFQRRQGVPPSSAQASMYSATLHYLRAVEKSGYSKGVEVTKAMRELKISPKDPMARNAYLREDGRLVKDMYLVEVKDPDKSNEFMDYLQLIRVIPGEEAFKPMEGGGCPYVENKQ